MNFPETNYKISEKPFFEINPKGFAKTKKP